MVSRPARHPESDGGFRRHTYPVEGRPSKGHPKLVQGLLDDARAVRDAVSRNRVAEALEVGISDVSAVRRIGGIPGSGRHAIAGKLEVSVGDVRARRLGIVRQGITHLLVVEVADVSAV